MCIRDSPKPTPCSLPRPLLMRVAHKGMPRRDCMKLHLGKVVLATAAVAMAALAPTTSLAQGTPAGIKIDTTSLGPTLATAAGMTLYTFGSDTVAGKSVCNARCATTWPAAAAPADAQPMGDWTCLLYTSPSPRD